MNIYKEFFKYVFQNILGTLGVSCYIIVDTFFIAQAAGVNGITVLNLALPVYNLIFAIGAMVGIGAATKFAILKAQKSKEAEFYFTNAILYLLFIGMIFVWVGIFTPDKVLQFMGADAEILQLGISYFRIFLLFTPFFMVNYAFTAFVRNDNDPSLAMIATVASSLSNIVFDYIFMFPLKMGLAGAALATVASPIISILICCLHFRRKTNTIHLVFKMPKIFRLIHSCQLGISAFIAELSSGITTMVFNFLILAIVSNIGVAAYGVVANFALVAVAIFNGITQGSQPLISRYYGKGEKKYSQKVLWLGIGTAIGIAVVLYAVIFGFTKPLVALFNSEKSIEMAAYAFEGMRLYFIGFFFAGFNMVVSGYFGATEYATASFVISIMRGVVAIVFFAFLLAYLFGFTGIWLSFLAAEAVTAIVAVIFLINNKKSLKN